MAGEEFPETGDRPYGPKLQAYIDARDSEVAAGAGSDASEQIAVHESSPNPHPQYETSGEVDVRVAAGGVAAITAHKAEADPHPQYETAGEATSKASAAITAHKAEVDPHPQYLLEAPVSLALPVNFDTVVANGLYVHGYNASSTNIPVADGGFLRVKVHPNNLISQVWESATGRILTRRRTTAGVWTAWAEETMLNHANAADPHSAAGYARKGVGGVFSAPQTFSVDGGAVFIDRPSAPANSRKWRFYVGPTGTLAIDPVTDVGVNNGPDVQFHRDGSVTTGGVKRVTGTGFPEGVISAPVGSEYTDTAATNGAIKWVKATGTGNTGWRVSDGDTGWVNLTGYAPNVTAHQGLAHFSRARRIGSHINLHVEVDTVAGWVANTTVLTLPAWAGPGYTYFPGGYAGTQYWISGNEVKIGGASGALIGRRTGLITYPVPSPNTPWPSVLTTA